jgi:type III pantothenate kinase
MNPVAVADVGNSRIKWGLTAGDKVQALASLPHGDPDSWQKQLHLWSLEGPGKWIVAGVHPGQRQALVDWLRQQGQEVEQLVDWSVLPLRVALDHPERAGIDRLLNAVAANERRPGQRPALIIDAGSAVTVDWVDASGVFRGGTIFPGLRLMAQALHDYTALLPLVQVSAETLSLSLPATTTLTAMQQGILWAAVGGILAIGHQLCLTSASGCAAYLTGGDARLLHPALEPIRSLDGFRLPPITLWEAMTLEGLRLTAGVLP